MSEERVGVKEAAEILGVSEKTVKNWITSKRLPAERIGQRTFAIRKADLARKDLDLQKAPQGRKFGAESKKKGG